MVLLTQFKDNLVNQCSGGMKRKLSLGMALIGGTQTIILDEPTSGLDVESRRQVWQLIAEMKANRSIIMSTQHIEEADELADRVCIMTHGELLALDTPKNIKSRFGVGYNVFLEPRNLNAPGHSPQKTEEMFKKLRSILLEERPEFEGVTESRDSSSRALIFLVPIAMQDRLAKLIREVETQVPECRIDIELNSLEDAYVKIAEDEIKANEESKDKQKQVFEK